MERILILDDEADMIDTCRRILAGAGYECLGTTDPREAIAKLESERPDLLLTDLRMPAMGGLDLMRRARELDASRPVIIFTAFATIESAVAAVREGAFDYLPKPFSIDQLIVSVERAMERGAAADDILEAERVAQLLAQVLVFEGEPPLKDFPIVKPEAFVPKRLKIDYKAGRWTGEFFLQKNQPA